MLWLKAELEGAALTQGLSLGLEIAG